MKNTLNIALPARHFSWGGGIELLRIIANAVVSVPEQREVRLFLLVPIKNRIDTFADARGIARTAIAATVRERRISLPRRAPAGDDAYLDLVSNIDGEIEVVEYNEATGLNSALRRIGADVLMPAGTPLGESFPIPWVGYLYDFQHKYFPENFDASECLSRDIHFATMLRDAKAIIVNAQSVKADIDKFFPYHDCEVFSLPFSAAPVTSWLEHAPPERLEQYRLPPRYFLISNQFWIHKSHDTAFEALALLRQDENYRDLHIVCTGKMEDYRFPDHTRGLRQKICDLQIEDHVHLLGHIPKIDQVAIMKDALAVLQPTLFEGGPGGGAVYDAVSLGVPTIVSSIPVNREIRNEANISYFDPGSAADLADTIREFLKQDIKRPVREELIAQGAHRKRLMGEHLLAAVDCVLRTP